MCYDSASRWRSASVLLVVWLCSAGAPHPAFASPAFEPLFRLAEAWHAAQYSGPSDLNGDQSVDAADLLMLLEGAPEAPTPTPTATPTPETLTVMLPGNVPIEFILVRRGSFTMGANDPPYSGPAESPPHTVEIPRRYYLAKYELTQRQWLALMGSWPQFPPTVATGIGDNKPAYYISWDDGHNFINALNALGQGTFRMPTEAEWEYACRAGSTTRYYFGDDGTQLSSYAWINVNNTPAGVKDVGGKLPNAWGFCDMLGNADEYVEDDWHDNYGRPGRPDDGAAWADVPRGASSVARGGFYLQSTLNAHSAYRRGFQKSTSRGEIHTLRIVREAPVTPTPTPTPTLLPGRESMTVLLPGNVPLEFLNVQAGSFTMGQDSPSLGPAHTVTIEHAFYLARYELTQKQWLAVIDHWPGTTPAYQPKPFLGLGDHYPAYALNWDDCHSLVDALNQLGLGHFRLPSEAEWEYACGAGTTTLYYFGDDIAELKNYAWYSGNNSVTPDPYGTKVVGRKPPNPWGFYDIIGNVHEWCEDDYHDNYGLQGIIAPVDGSAWIDAPRGTNAILKGGGYLSAAGECMTPYRIHLAKSGDNSRGSTGVRLVWEP